MRERPRTLRGKPEDAARHRRSVLAWLRSHGYQSLEAIAAADHEVQSMARSARVQEGDLMSEDERVVRGPRGEVRIRFLAPGQEPPPPGSVPSVYEGILSAAHERPGIWVHVPHASPSTGQELRRRGCEVAQRRNGDERRVELYVRLRPDGQSES